ncbi:GGDEF and EAL domain-containing protein [Aliikangiella coralliicola]|uniref:cyclic-guanylate-specific phosphodiesterase n=1 Tax=Aliikangiella coralliicola TaxID=2592383 RepID=A0A545UIQ9_9GAMM|nr:GGDEF and EAL domain-containing protein [Aliikangiella coralliicola]TQV89350.1 EAL domain-containing protein [Aliikangiella coralliicola]
MAEQVNKDSSSSKKSNEGNPDSGELASNILNQLDIAAFCWTDQGFFNSIGTPPDWFIELYQKKTRAIKPEYHEFYLGVSFPFIENFLFDAEQIWAEHANKNLRSGLWTETVNDFSELYLEAVAMNANKVPILLLMNETTNFEIRHKVFQNARNLALKNEQLENSIQQHQRELQKQLEKIYNPSSSSNELSSELEEETTAIMICKQDGDVELYNKALIDIYSLSAKEELKRQSLLDQWIKEAEKQYPEIHRVIKSGNQWEGEFETVDVNTEKKWVRLMIAPLVNEDNQIARYICIANDISSIKLSVSEIEKLTQIDPTTHLPNRQSFWKKLAEEIDNCRQSGESLALMYLDLDHFKQVNDDLGPKQADFLLNTVATRLKRCLKKCDYVAHLGGDEFAVVICNFSDQQALANIAQRIKDNLYRDVSFSDFTLNVSASIGIAVYPQHGIKPRLLVKSADYAMYHAKEMGRNQFQFSSPYSKRRIKQKLYIEQGLKSALANNEFKLLYQPQISVGKSTEHRIEALIRWMHPTQGLVTPADFISIAEESGIIIDIGKWVLKSACEQISILRNAGIYTKISINVSPKQFKYSDLTEDVRSTLQEFKIDPSQLEIEVTESIFVEEMDDVIKQLEALRALGVSISLDDFGTGYSSLSYLKRLPLNILKIDRSFISELPNNKHSQTIVESIIRMAHQLSIQVIAEGVENQAQLDYLKKLDCDFVQGYLFSIPLETRELFTLYQSLSVQ